MAYMSQDKKAKIANELKKVMPKTWKYSLAVNNHSTIVLNIKSAPIDLCDAWFKFNSEKCQIHSVDSKPESLQVNPYWIDENWPKEIAETLKLILSALNLDNHNNSDSMTDYFDVGHYVDVNIGRWNKPFIVK